MAVAMAEGVMAEGARVVGWEVAVMEAVVMEAVEAEVMEFACVAEDFAKAMLRAVTRAAPSRAREKAKRAAEAARTAEWWWSVKGWRIFPITKVVHETRLVNQARDVVGRRLSASLGPPLPTAIYGSLSARLVLMFLDGFDPHEIRRIMGSHRLFSLAVQEMLALLEEGGDDHARRACESMYLTLGNRPPPEWWENVS